MKHLVIDPKAAAAVDNFKAPTYQGFGTVISPVMVDAEYVNGEWRNLKLIPYGPIALDPCAKVLHYAHEIFEGMKAYYVATSRPVIFRPDQNFERFNISATRMGMPTVPREFFFEALNAIVSYSESVIPRESGKSLYLRPFMIATEARLGLQPSNSFRFMVVASPAETYFSSNVNVMIERNSSRAAPGGTGAVKAGGNYAAGIQATLKSNKLGYQQILWLDALSHRYVEELSGMNFFAVINDTLTTPALTDTILAGVTRSSIPHLAQGLQLKTSETKIEINTLIKQIKSGECTEAFACGTAAMVSPLTSLGEEAGEKYVFQHASGPWTEKIRQSLVNIQEGRDPGPSNWMHVVPTRDQL